MRLYPPFSVRRIPTFLEGIRYAEPWYAVRQQECKWYAYAEFCVLQEKFIQLEVQKGCIKRIDRKSEHIFFLARFARSHHYIFISNKFSRSFYLGFIIMDIFDLISIRVCLILSVRDWNQYGFHLHYLLAVEIPNCTTPYFEGRRDQTYVVNIIYALNTQTNFISRKWE